MTMETTNLFPSLRDLPLDVRLTAWLDGQMSAEETAEIEHLVANDDEARILLDKLTAGAEFGSNAFDDMLADPVPLHLVRAIKDAAKTAGTDARPSVRPANSNGFFSFMPQLVAASAILLLAGGYSGYFIGLNNADRGAVEISETSVFAPAEQAAEGGKTRGFEMPANPAPDAAAFPLEDMMAGYHKVYSAQSARLSEMPVTDTDAIKTWLTDATDVEFSIPDLSADGFSLAGARLLAAGDRPMGALFYRNDLGETVMVGFWAEAETEIRAAVKPVAFAKASVSRFHKGQTAIAVVAPVEFKNTADLVGKIQSGL
jgi:anti-sigma factor RsiW